MKVFSRFAGLCSACAWLGLTLAACGHGFSAEDGWRMWLDAVSPSKERVSVNGVIGADAACRRNLFGQGVRVANIEPGLLWNGHLLFRHVPAERLYTGVEAVPNHVDPHATGVCGALAGDSGVYDSRNKGMGIAPRVELHSASFYTEPDSHGAPFTHTSLVTAFRKFFGWADVVNTSWGTVWPAQTLEYYSYLTDALCRRHPGTVFFAASGNTGNLPDEKLKGKVSTIASGFNNIAVGALGNPPAFDRLYANSSFKPVDFINPATNRREGVRAGVDLVAPGEGLVIPAMVPGHPERKDAARKSAGTSLACPVAAGVGALLVQAAKEAGLKAPELDARLVKALLLNAAAKPKDWQNGMDASTYAGNENVLLTTQALDYRYGAGGVDAGEALRLLDAGRGKAWQRATMHPGGERVQDLGSLTRGETVTATLVWFQDCVMKGLDSLPADNVLAEQSAQKGRDPLGRPELEYRGMADYALELWAGRPEDMKAARLVAVSDTPNNTVEHFKANIPANGDYFLRIVFKGMTYGKAPREGEPSVWTWSVR